MKKLSKIIISALSVLLLQNVSSNSFNNKRIKYADNESENLTEFELNSDFVDSFVSFDNGEVSFDEESYQSYFESDQIQTNYTSESINNAKEKAKDINKVADAMNKLASSGLGHIDSKGNFIQDEYVDNSIYKDEAKKQEAIKAIKEIPHIDPIKNNLFDQFKLMCNTPFTKRWSWNFFTGFDITFGALGSFTMGVIGFLINSYIWISSFDLPDVKITTEDFLTGGLLDNPTILEKYMQKYIPYILTSPEFSTIVSWVESLCGDFGDILTVLTNCAFLVLGVMYTISTTSGLIMIINIITAIASIYLPDLTTGLSMSINGLFNLYDTYANIGWMWSEYTVIA